MRKIRALRLKGWWAFGAWTLAWPIIFLCTFDPAVEQPWPSIGVLVFLAMVIGARLRAAIPGFITGICLMFGIAVLFDDPPKILGCLYGLAGAALGVAMFAAGRHWALKRDGRPAAAAPDA